MTYKSIKYTALSVLKKTGMALICSCACVLFSSSVASAQRAYDCPASLSQARNDYVCLMTGTFGPKYYNAWGEIKSKTRVMFNGYRNARFKCIAKCTKNGSNAACLKQCDTSALGTGVKFNFRRALPLAKDMEMECNRSAGAQACEQQEAQPYCSEMTPRLKTYKKAVSGLKASTAQRASEFINVMISIGRALNTRLSTLSMELRQKKWKCTAEQAKLADVPATRNSLEQVCMVPQYNYNISLSTLLAPDTSSAITSVSARTPQNVAIDTLDQIDPSPSLDGVTCKHCWTECSSFLLNDMHGALIPDMMTSCNYNSDWAIGDILSVGGDQFQITRANGCQYYSAKDIAVKALNPSAIQNKVYPANSCIKNLTRGSGGWTLPDY